MKATVYVRKDDRGISHAKLVKLVGELSCCMRGKSTIECDGRVVEEMRGTKIEFIGEDGMMLGGFQYSKGLPVVQEWWVIPAEA